MTQAIKLIERAFGRIGVLASGEALDGNQTLDGLDALNDILDLWNTESLAVYKSIEATHPLTSAMSYTIGPGGQIDALRPLFIQSAFIRTQGLDSPVTVIGDDRFDGIVLKTLGGWPRYLRYAPDMPLGRIDVWPQGSGHTLHLRYAMQFDQPVSPADDLVLPPGYRMALILALAVQLCDPYGRDVTQSLYTGAAEAKAAIMRTNINADVQEAAHDPALAAMAGGYHRFLAG